MDRVADVTLLDVMAYGEDKDRTSAAKAARPLAGPKAVEKPAPDPSGLPGDWMIRTPPETPR